MNAMKEFVAGYKEGVARRERRRIGAARADAGEEARASSDLAPGGAINSTFATHR